VRRGIGFGDPDGIGGGGESEAIEHILPPPQPEIEMGNRK